jgi:divalent metal cation (Fe/Co/Zn/Cd) transporter
VAFYFGYGAPVMIGLGYGLIALGLPDQFGEWVPGWGFLLGTGLALMIAAAWTGIILMAWAAFFSPLLGSFFRIQSIARTIFGVMLTIFGISLGMISTAFGLQWLNLPLMPQEHEWLRLGALWVAAFLGFIMVWIFHYPIAFPTRRHTAEIA